MRSDEPDQEEYDVVANDEDQYSIWRVDQTIPDGWLTVGFRGSREDCLNHINTIWTDMRPRSLREFMAANDKP